MACFVSRCHSVDLLDGTARRRLDELVVPALGPVDREAHDDERLTSAVVVKAERIHVALADPFRQERLQDKRPYQALDVNTAERGDGVTVGGVHGGEGGRVVLDGRGSEDLAPAGRVEHVQFVSRAG